MLGTFKAVVCRRFEPLLPPHPTHRSVFYIFCESPLLTTLFLTNSASLKYRKNTKIKSCGKVISSFLEGKNHRYMLFYKQHFYNQHQAENWSEIITMPCIRSQKKNKHPKWKTCSVKRSLLRHSYIINETCSAYPVFYRHVLPIWTNPIFTGKSWFPFYDF